MRTRYVLVGTDGRELPRLEPWTTHRAAMVSVELRPGGHDEEDEMIVTLVIEEPTG